MGRFGTEVLQPSVNREPAHRWPADAKVGGVSIQPPRLLQDERRRPDQIEFCQWPGPVGKRFHRISLGSARSDQTAARALDV